MPIKYSKEQVVDYLKDNLQKFKDYYSDSDFLKASASLAKKAGVNTIYIALQLYYAMKSDKVPLTDKILVMAALGYFIAPIDLIPDVLVGIGLIDDGIILSWALKKIHSYITPEIKAKAKDQLLKWLPEAKID